MLISYLPSSIMFPSLLEQITTKPSGIEHHRRILFQLWMSEVQNGFLWAGVKGVGRSAFLLEALGEESVSLPCPASISHGQLSTRDSFFENIVTLNLWSQVPHLFSFRFFLSFIF